MLPVLRSDVTLADSPRAALGSARELLLMALRSFLRDVNGRRGTPGNKVGG